jgi:cysteine desulfurase
VEAPTLLIRLDLEGVAASAGSACSAGSTEPSHVLAALDIPYWAKLGTVRFSFGKLTTGQDVERLVGMLPEILGSVRDDAPELGTQHCGVAQARTEERF